MVVVVGIVVGFGIAVVCVVVVVIGVIDAFGVVAVVVVIVVVSSCVYFTCCKKEFTLRSKIHHTL